MLDPDTHLFNGCIKENMDDDADDAYNPYVFFLDDVKNTKQDKDNDCSGTNDLVKKRMVFNKSVKITDMKKIVEP